MKHYIINNAFAIKQGYSPGILLYTTPTLPSDLNYSRAQSAHNRHYGFSRVFQSAKQSLTSR